jgi:hypothetical protein
MNQKEEKKAKKKYKAICRHRREGFEQSCADFFIEHYRI